MHSQSISVVAGLEEHERDEDGARNERKENEEGEFEDIVDFGGESAADVDAERRRCEYGEAHFGTKPPTGNQTAPREIRGAIKVRHSKIHIGRSD